MIYIIINLGIAAYLTWASFNVNTKNMRNEKSLINIALLSAVTATLTVVTMLMVLWGPERFTVFLERALLFLLAAIHISISFYFLGNSVKRGKLFSFFEFAFFLFALYIVSSRIQIADYTRFVFKSSVLVKGEQAEFFPLTWFQLYIALFGFALPGMSVLIMTLAAENSKSRQALQKSMLFAGSTAFAWIAGCAVAYISQTLPMMISHYTGV